MEDPSFGEREPGRARLRAAAAEAALADVWRRVQRSPDEGYQRYAQALERYNCEAAARLHNSTSAAQRAVAQQRLRGWQADLRLLAAAR